MALTITGMHQDHHPPRPSVGSPATLVSTNASQVINPRVLAVLPNATATRGTGTAHTQDAHRLPQVAQASGPAYHAPRTRITPQPNVSVASGRPAAFSPPPPPPPSANPSSPRPRPRPRPPPSNQPYSASSSSFDNQDRAGSRGFHYAEGTNSRTQMRDQARVFAGSRIGTGTPTVVDADRRGRYLVGPENFARSVPMARMYLDGAWGVTPGTKESLGLAD